MTLIDRLKAATGPDRELDGDIFQSYGGTMWDKAYAAAQEPCGCPHDTAVEDARFHAPTFTSSIDAALALVERMLPDWDWEVGRYNVTYHSASIWRRGRRDQTQHGGNGVNPSIAILTALFTALQGKDAYADK